MHRKCSSRKFLFTSSVKSRAPSISHTQKPRNRIGKRATKVQVQASSIQVFSSLRVSARRWNCFAGGEARRDFPRDLLRNRESLGFSIHPPICQSVSNPFHNSRSHDERLTSERANTIAHRAENQGDKIRRPIRGDCLSRRVLRTRFAPYRGNYQRIFVSGQISCRRTLGLLALETTWPRFVDVSAMASRRRVHVIAADRNYR